MSIISRIIRKPALHTENEREEENRRVLRFLSSPNKAALSDVTVAVEAYLTCLKMSVEREISAAKATEFQPNLSAVSLLKEWADQRNKQKNNEAGLFHKKQRVNLNAAKTHYSKNNNNNNHLY